MLVKMFNCYVIGNLERRFQFFIAYTMNWLNLLHQGLSEPKFYDGLVYKFKNIMDRTDFSDQFRKMKIRHKIIGY